MPARIIIDVEKADDGYRAEIVGAEGIRVIRRSSFSQAMADLAFMVGLASGFGGVSRHRDIAARIMAEIEGEQ